jgi:diacylglycerol kinase family enzyme
MPLAVLVVNSAAGRARFFAACSGAIAGALEAQGFEVRVETTGPDPDSARVLAAQASASAELVIACGGDGTVHGVLQGIAETQACLGALPFGTANALARNLGLPLDPVAAIQKLLTFTPRSLPLCVARTAREQRWFAVMAGAGPDGRLVHELAVAAKKRVGRGAYYGTALRLLLTRRFPAFHVEYRQMRSKSWQSREAIAMMASRIPDLGGAFRGLTAQSRLDHPHLLVQLLAAPAALSLPAWLAYARLGCSARNPWLATVEVEELRCSPVEGNSIPYAQVDGEPLGEIPFSIGIAPAAGLKLLMP